MRRLRAALAMTLLAVAAMSCRSVRHESATDDRQHTRREETLRVRDSIVWIVRDSTVVHHAGDALVIERWRDRVVERNDTVTVSDTVRLTETKYIEKTPAPPGDTHGRHWPSSPYACCWSSYG